MSEELLSLFYPLSDIERQIQEGQMKPPESQARDGLVLRRDSFPLYCSVPARTVPFAHNESLFL